MGTAFGIGLPGTYPVHASPWGITPLASFGTGGSPLVSPGLGQPLAQLVQSLQSAPYQLQQLLQLEYLQLQHIQQLLQIVPAQLQQLQQLIQFIPYQFQQLQHQPQTQQYGHPFMPTPSFNVPFTGSAQVM